MESASYVGGPLDGQSTERKTSRWAAYLDESGARIKHREMRHHANGLYRYTERWDTSTRPSVKIREYVHSTIDTDGLNELRGAA